MLDNSVVLHANEYGHNLPPDSHYHKNIPIVVAGGAGTLKTGTYLNHLAGGVPSSKAGTMFHNRVLTSCINAVGIPTENWGNPMDDADGPKTAAKVGGDNFGDLRGLRKS